VSSVGKKRKGGDTRQAHQTVSLDVRHSSSCGPTCPESLRPASHRLRGDTCFGCVPWFVVRVCLLFILFADGAGERMNGGVRLVDYSFGTIMVMVMVMLILFASFLYGPRSNRVFKNRYSFRMGLFEFYWLIFVRLSLASSRLYPSLA
jgi:hypothetical protein